MHWIFEPAEYRLIKVDCVCDLEHSYKCQKDFCSTSKRACDLFNDKFNEKKQNDLKFHMNSCQ